jgi:putative ABC transport system permease protein
MNELIRQTRVALRGLRRTPAFTIAALLVLGFGIGTAAAMFTVFRAVLLEQLPVRDPERVISLSTYKNPGLEFGLIRRDLTDIGRESRTLRAIGGYAHWGATPGVLLDGDRSVLLNRVLATGNFFDVLGARPLLGRLFRPEDDPPGGPLVLVLSYKAWRGAFGGDPHIVGRQLLEPYAQQTYTVIGVAPPGLDYPSGAGYWIPPWKGNETMGIVGVARLAQSASPAAARAELFAIKNRLSPELHLVGAMSTSITKAIIGDVRPVLVALVAAVGLLLLIACVNVGNLLMLRASSRARELAIRRALGATYGDIVKQLLLESGLLAIGGGMLGLACAEVLLRVLIALAPAQLPRIDVVQVSGMPIAIAIGVTTAALLVFGVGPAMMAARSDVASTLRLDARSGRDTASRRHVRSLLVASQTALALVMLSGALLLARSLTRLQNLALGYRPEHLSFLGASWPAPKLGVGIQLYPLGEQIVRHWRAVPGVISVTPVLIPPLLGPNVFLGRADAEGQSDADLASNPIVPIEAGNEDFFRTLGISITRGRGFQESDRENAQQVAVVSEAVARRFWPNQDPIGKRIHYWSGTDSTAWRTIVGVTGDIHLRSMRDATPTIYVPWRQANFWQLNLAVRTSGTLSSVLPALRHELHAVEPQLNLWYTKSMDELLDAPLAQPRLSALLMSAFGLAALLLAAIGLYGLMASIVRDSTREMGVRMALGALPERVRREVLGRALAVSGIGAIVGAAFALATSRLLTALLFEVSPTDPIALGVAAAVLMIVAFLAAFVPAHRATKIDPALALRSE